MIGYFLEFHIWKNKDIINYIKNEKGIAHHVLGRTGVNGLDRMFNRIELYIVSVELTVSLTQLIVVEVVMPILDRSSCRS